MSKIERYQGNVQAFASSAQGVERTVFGETTQANDLTSQITAAFLRGWGIVGPSEHPSLEDFNGAMYALSQFIAYQHQAGIPEWHEEQEYYAGSVCTHTGVAYQSIEDANTGNEPPSAHWTPVITERTGSEYFQSLNATLTALATLAGTKDKMPYFSGEDTAALTALTAFARQILGQTNAAGVLSTIGLTQLGIGGTGTSLPSLDWQTFDFVPGAEYNVSSLNITNTPPGLTIPSGTYGVLINVTGYEGNNRHVEVWISTTTAANYYHYEVRVTNNNNPGSRAFTVRQIWTSSNIIPVSAGGTGGTTAADARTNLELKSAATRDVGTGANQIPDMSAWTGSFGASESAGTWYKMPNGIIVQEGLFNSVSSGQVSVTLPIPFTSRILSFSATKNDGFYTPIISPNGTSLSTFYLGATNGSGWAADNKIHWRLEGI